MQSERTPLTRSDLRDLERWMRRGWLPNEYAVERILAVVADRNANHRAVVRAVRLLHEIQMTAVRIAHEIGPDDDSDEIAHDGPIDSTSDRHDAT